MSPLTARELARAWAQHRNLDRRREETLELWNARLMGIVAGAD
jgi:hypothetical protein